MMHLYLWLKFIHVISSTILFGTGIGTACTLLYANSSKNVAAIASATRYVVLADWCFTGASGFLQPLTGFWMVYLMGYSWTSLWIIGSIIGYLIAGFCWFPVVYLQIKMRDFAAAAVNTNTALPSIYFRYFRYWTLLGIPAFAALIIVFYLMTSKPVL
jgi:hypothetical protein